MSASGMLTEAERRAIELAGQIASIYAKEIVISGPTRSADIAEFFARIHDIQHAVMAQAAARAYPDLYRLAGDSFSERKDTP